VAEGRFLPLAVVQQELSLSQNQVMKLIASGDLPAVKMLGLWRVERSALEELIRRLYISTAAGLRTPPDTVPAGPKGNTGPLENERRSPAGRVGQERQVDLTPQMRRVLELVARGRSNSEIAEDLTIEVSTVKSHVSRLLSRLDCRDRENLIAFAWRSGVVRPQETDSGS